MHDRVCLSDKEWRASRDRQVREKVMAALNSLFTDADNTLWDTNAVYARAQLLLLHSLAGEHMFESDVEALDFVRRIDQRIARLHPKGLRFPPMLLASALQ